MPWPLVPALALLASSLAVPARAFIDTGLDTVWSSQTQLAANPPLPMLRLRPGAWRVTLTPAYLTASPGVDEYYEDQYEADGDFSGWGGGAAFTYGLSEKNGLYAWMLRSGTSGDATVTQTAGCSGDCQTYRLTDVESSLTLLSAGWVRQLAGGGEGRFSLPVFFGPIVSRTSSSQSLLRSAQGFGVLDDLDMEIEDTSFGFALGAQAAVPLGRSGRWELNPFLLSAVFFTDGCAEYEVTRQGADNGQSSVSDPDCDGPRELMAGEDPFGLALGVNLTYVPWNLSVNLTAPFLGGWMARNVYDERASVSVLSLSWSFGGRR